ncbi:hypothetical protein CTI12_AA236340 [Artemisia annua]|uniref:OTU domain-containing protein n=1 Tax=Artemisia annua TaxID=35608 RepID=A0A2U1NR94_ARTAN|nr:hypothetical protein CTI12_AA236340 [Artemisia annua]
MWEPKCGGNWGPSYEDIEEFFSYGYYGDYGYHYHTDNDNQHPYSPLSPYHQDNLYPDVDNRLLVSLEHGISGLSIADSNEGIGKSNSSYIPESQSCEEKKNVELEITDEPELNGKVSQITPVAHVPKVNGDIPSLDEASTDHQRLLDRLDTYNFVEVPVEGDGNCQFRALSDQLYRTPEHHKSVRKRVVAQYGVKILVLTSFKDTIFIEILPKVLKSRRVFFLSYWAEVHYNSMYPKADLAVFFSVDLYITVDFSW